MRSIILIISLLFSIQAIACSVPINGQEIDEKINLESVGGFNYKVTVPKKVLHLDFGVTISLIYYEEGDSLRRAKEYEDLTPSLDGDEYSVSFEVPPKKGLIPYISVAWEPESCCLCAAIGRTRDITH